MFEYLQWQITLYGGGVILLFTVLLLLLWHLISPILWPTIITYPWDEGNNHKTSRTTTTTTTATTVIFAASYNPPHNGHLAMLQYLATKYNRVIAVVGFNPDKKYLVSPQQRAELLREMIRQDNTSQGATATTTTASTNIHVQGTCIV
jgi:cytidyltransferase-like protein